MARDADDSWARWLEGDGDSGLWPWLADLATGWRPPATPLPCIDDPVAEAERIRARSVQEGVWPTAVERLVLRDPTGTPWSFVFLHGFGATRAGGEAVMDALAEDLAANLWYPLLPGHGRDPAAHAEAPAEAYLQTAAHALAMGRALGERVCLVGSSTGGLLATWLAATWPELVDALVLVSPLFAFADPSARILQIPYGLETVEAARGPVRDARFGEDPEERRVDGYQDRWLTEQRYQALAHLERLRGWIAQDATYREVQCPVLLLYAPEDDVVDLAAMHHAFGAMGPNRLSRFVPIEDGHHVLMSAWVRTDKEAVRTALDRFLEAVFDAVRSEGEPRTSPHPTGDSPG